MTRTREILNSAIKNTEPATPPVRYPLGLALYLRGSELVADGSFLALGIVAASRLPPASVGHSYGLRWAWTVLIIAGAALAIAGTLGRWDGPKVLGICLSGTGIVTWCAAILAMGPPTNGQTIVVLAFLGTVALFSYRLGAHFALVFIRQLRA